MAIDRITELLDTTRLLVAAPIEPVHPDPGIQQIPQATSRWLAAASTSKTALDDPHGWYQRTLAADAAALGVNVLQLAVGNLSPEERQETQVFTRHTLDRSVGRIRPFALPAIPMLGRRLAGQCSSKPINAWLHTRELFIASFGWASYACLSAASAV